MSPQAPRASAFSRRAFALGVGGAVVANTLPAFARPAPVLTPIPVFPISIAVAVDGGRAVREEPWIAAQLAEVERLFEPFGLRFQREPLRALPSRYARLETRADRDALDAERVVGVVNAFVVAALRDVDDTRMYRMGVHWRNTKMPGHRYVIATMDALTSTLAHELGHFFGLPHAKTLNNLMSYSRNGADVFLTRGQGSTMRSFARIALASGEVVSPES